ncbi:NADH:flavin oxidoreductase [Dehalobacter sp. DCM]|uniref:NADH:flavin oxidoreductase n=1 Tax=Dehalobacter sp. DCM TaxID=2907827 RepID=UPI00308187EC|nr:NADH:flavin oxidoreductase [Dehalobacter sp. DCM]
MAELFSSLQIKGLTLKNRLVMPPMALDNAAENGEITEEQIDHYTVRARPDNILNTGIGLIIVEHTFIHPKGKSHVRQLGIDDDAKISGLKYMTEAVHQEGVPLGIQITHAGARALYNPVAPSAEFCPHIIRNKPMTDPNDPPHELTVAEISDIIQYFADAARRAKKAGFDLIEIHGAHGYLLNQFYSPLTNKRTDNYGGSLVNRMRFPCEVISAVREAVGSDMPVFYRLGADDRLPGGTTIQDSIEAVPYFIKAGIDCLDLSGGICGYLKNGPEAFFAYMAEALKPVVHIPVLVTGGIKTVQTAVELVKNDTTDLVGVGRAMLSDPDWARNARKAVSPC